jgi:hypothetical protein
MVFALAGACSVGEDHLTEIEAGQAGEPIYAIRVVGASFDPAALAEDGLDRVRVEAELSLRQRDHGNAYGSSHTRVSSDAPVIGASVSWSAPSLMVPASDAVPIVRFVATGDDHQISYCALELDPSSLPVSGSARVTRPAAECEVHALPWESPDMDRYLVRLTEIAFEVTRVPVAGRFAVRLEQTATEDWGQGDRWDPDNLLWARNPDTRIMVDTPVTEPWWSEIAWDTFKPGWGFDIATGEAAALSVFPITIQSVDCDDDACEAYQPMWTCTFRVQLIDIAYGDAYVAARSCEETDPDAWSPETEALEEIRLSIRPY